MGGTVWVAKQQEVGRLFVPNLLRDLCEPIQLRCASSSAARSATPSLRSGLKAKTGHRFSTKLPDFLSASVFLKNALQPLRTPQTGAAIHAGGARAGVLDLAAAALGAGQAVPEPDRQLIGGVRRRVEQFLGTTMRL